MDRELKSVSYEKVSIKPEDISPMLNGGIIKKILKFGVGTTSPNNGNVTINYIGRFTDGTVFDTNYEKEPFTFQIRKGSVIKAFDIAVVTMKKNERSEFTVKPQYAYGKIGCRPLIPPDTDLVFEIELISWSAEDISPKKDGSILRTIVHVGEGFSTPNDGAFVNIHVTGDYEERIIEDRDVEFYIGEGSVQGVIRGVEIALEKFKKKEISELTIQSKHGFGSKGNTELGVPPDADLKYTVFLKNFEKSKECWAITSTDKLEQAVFFKERGTKYFHDSNLPLAIRLYNKAKDYIRSEVGFSDEEEIKRKELFVAIHLNLALCHLKTNAYLEARDLCNAAIEKDPNNAKAYFRRGQAYKQLNDPVLAKVDFEKVLSLDPKNQSAAREIVLCDKLKLSHQEREKVIYANMFEKFAKHDQEKEEEIRKQQPDVMKTLGEWGKDERAREPTEFEKENPNILMLDGTGDFKNM